MGGPSCRDSGNESDTNTGTQMAENYRQRLKGSSTRGQFSGRRRSSLGLGSASPPSPGTRTSLGWSPTALCFPSPHRKLTQLRCPSRHPAIFRDPGDAEGQIGWGSAISAEVSVQGSAVGLLYRCHQTPPSRTLLALAASHIQNASGTAKIPASSDPHGRAFSAYHWAPRQLSGALRQKATWEARVSRARSSGRIMSLLMRAYHAGLSAPDCAGLSPGERWKIADEIEGSEVLFNRLRRPLRSARSLVSITRLSVRSSTRSHK